MCYSAAFVLPDARAVKYKRGGVAGRHSCAYPKLSLAPIIASQGRPYHLWDTSECRTIETHRFANDLDYACISHTWGRWVDKSKEPFQIPGVPWPVPRIRPERFDVSELPHQVKKLGHRYVWLDLFSSSERAMEFEALTTNPG